MSELNRQQLPLGWVRTRIEQIANLVSGNPAPQGPEFFSAFGVPFVRVQDMGRLGNKMYMSETKDCLSEKGAKGLQLFASGSVLFTKSGASTLLNQRAVLSRPMHVVSHIAVAAVEHEVSHRYFYYWLLTVDFAHFAHATTLPSLQISKVKTINVPLAPAAEQIRIADALDELLSDLDAGVAALERVQAKLKQYRAAVLKAAVEGSLTAEWRAQNPATEPASALLSRILAERHHRWEEAQLKKFKEAGKTPPSNWKAKYKEPVAPDTTDLAPLPEGCCWASLDQLADIAGGVTKGQKFSPKAKTRVVPYLRVANVQRGFLDLSKIKEIRALESDIEALRLRSGDVLFNEGGDRDKLGRGWIWEGKVEECIHQNHVFRARIFLSDVNPKLISWCGNSYGQRWFMRTGKQSVNLASINMTVLRSFPVPLAPSAEQDAIVETVEDQISVIDHLETDLEAKLKNAQALRQSILRHAFTGKLVPQDPNDEPATELLKRIAVQRQERARLLLATKKTQPKASPKSAAKKTRKKPAHD